MPKGSNPNSKANLVAGKNKKCVTRTELTLTQKTRKAIAAAGDGNMSEGVEKMASLFEEMSQDRLFAQAPVFARCKFLLEAIASNPGQVSALLDRIEAVLIDLQDLEISEAYKEAVLDGAIKPPKGDAYII